jgi:hypothetical protein
VNRTAWESADGRAVRAHVASVAERTGASPLRVHRRRYGTRLRWNATFALAERVFALVPGGEARLGYDPAGFTPTAAELGSFRCADDPSGSDPLSTWSLDGPLDDEDDGLAALPDRPLPGQLELFPAANGDPAPGGHVPGSLAGGAREPAPTVAGGGPVAALRGHLAGTLAPPRRAVLPTLLVAVDPIPLPPDATHAGVVDSLAARGMRLPTPDEWEHARGAGDGALFPWGERFPAPGGRDPVFRLPCGAVVDRTDGDAWGLRGTGGGADELTADPGEVRGSDGGVAGCGGMPRFYHWLIEAPAFRDPEHLARHRAGDSHYPKAYRPVLTVDG